MPPPINLMSKKIFGLAKLFYYELLLSVYDIGYTQKGPVFFDIEKALEENNETNLQDGFDRLKKLLREGK